MTRRYSARWFYGFSAAFALAGAAGITYSLVARANWLDYALGGLWLLLAASWFAVARQLRCRERLGFDQELPAASQDVLALLSQGRRIGAIRRYRQLNPGIGLREAMHVIDESAGTPSA